MSKRFIAVILSGIILLSCVPFSASAVEANEIRKIADGIAAWKKSDVGATPDGYLINERFLELAGTTPGDWFPIGLSRLGVEDNYSGYLAVIKDRIEARYAEPGKLSAAKATEWHRMHIIRLSAVQKGNNNYLYAKWDGTLLQNAVPEFISELVRS